MASVLSLVSRTQTQVGAWPRNAMSKFFLSHFIFIDLTVLETGIKLTSGGSLFNESQTSLRSQMTREHVWNYSSTEIGWGKANSREVCLVWSWTYSYLQFELRGKLAYVNFARSGTPFPFTVPFVDALIFAFLFMDIFQHACRAWHGTEWI